MLKYFDFMLHVKNRRTLAQRLDADCITRSVKRDKSSKTDIKIYTRALLKKVKRSH